ncbi:hypothetical protein Q9R32_01565 [Actinotalea sp. AC32]|nr:hypothetical protein [Actinotalea sp. AC32]
MDRGPHPDFTAWLVTHGDPRPSVMLPRPRRALVGGRTYGGVAVVVEVDVVARARGFVCVRQEVVGHDAWHAWVPASHAEPLPRELAR